MTFWSLVSRHNKVFRRDRTLVFFSLLSIIIVIALYMIFLQKMQLSTIEQMTVATDELKVMVNEWLVAGLLSMLAVTSTLAAFNITVDDIESKAAADFLTAPLSRATIQFSYVVNAFVIGLAFSVIGLIVCEVFLVATGGQLLSWAVLVRVLGILVLTVLLASAFNMLLVLFVQSVSAFSTLSTIVGTAIGFLSGLYVPLGVLPSFAQQIVMFFPLSHTGLLLREAFMADSFATVFAGAPADVLLDYKLMYGVSYDMFGTVLTQGASIAIVIGATVVLALLAVLRFRQQQRVK